MDIIGFPMDSTVAGWQFEHANLSYINLKLTSIANKSVSEAITSIRKDGVSIYLSL